MLMDAVLSTGNTACKAIKVSVCVSPNVAIQQQIAGCQKAMRRDRVEREQQSKLLDLKSSELLLRLML